MTLTVAPDEGYLTAGVIVTDAKGNDVPVTRNADGTYSFTMPAAMVVTMHGVINGMGDGTLAPKDNATRSQITAMFMRFCEELEKKKVQTIARPGSSKAVRAWYVMKCLNQWLMLLLAALLEETWSATMKASSGFTEILPALITGAGYLLSAFSCRWR